MERYSIITNNLNNCIICGRTKEALHEVFFGTANRKKSIQYGLVIPLCNYHHNMSDEGIHFNRNLDLSYKKIAEKRWLEHYNKTKEEFIQEFGKNYIEED